MRRSRASEPPETPTFFAKFRNALAAPGATVPLPAWSEQVDYEAEVAFVMRRPLQGRAGGARRIDHVAGYTLLNDLSARDYQFKTPQWMPGKTFDGAAPCGPALVTPDEAGPHDAIEIELTLNGELMQKGSTADLVHSVPGAGGVPVEADDARAGRHRLHRHARGRGQPARPEGVAEAGRRGRDQLAAARRARDAARPRPRSRPRGRAPRPAGPRCGARPRSGRWRRGPGRRCASSATAPPFAETLTSVIARSRLRSSCSASRMTPQSRRRRWSSPGSARSPRSDASGSPLRW